ncbi:hypothetical protein RB595_000342 [Gaeumannomyces hyphopodioides]
MFPPCPLVAIPPWGVTEFRDREANPLLGFIEFRDREKLDLDTMEFRRPGLLNPANSPAEKVSKGGDIEYSLPAANGHFLEIPQERQPWTREAEPKLSQPLPEARPRTESRDHLHPSMPITVELCYSSTTPERLAGGPTAGDVTCPCFVYREIVLSDAQHVKYEDVEKFALRDDPGQDMRTSPCGKGTSWDSGLACPTTVSQRPPKPLRLVLIGVSITGAVLMTQWRWEYMSKWPDKLQSHFTQPELLSHPGVLVLGISLHCVALTLLYHLNGGGKRHDTFLIPITGSTALLASLLGLELSTILLRATPWASIIALCASTCGKWCSE